jgi:hypothetical protein
MDLNPLNLMKHSKGKLTADSKNMDAKYRELEFMFNPKSYKISRQANVQEKTTAAASDGNDLSHKGANNATLDMELYLDDWEGLPFGLFSSDKHSVSHAIETLLVWVAPTADSIKNNKQNPEPPLLNLDWGGPRFKGYITSVTVDVSLFRKDGTPARATANVQMKAAPDWTPKQNPTSGALQGRATHVVADGDSLQSVAYGEYRNPNLWRGIAAFNGIDDPLRVQPGARLLIPTSAEAARLT